MGIGLIISADRIGDESYVAVYQILTFVFALFYITLVSFEGMILVQALGCDRLVLTLEILTIFRG